MNARQPKPIVHTVLALLIAFVVVSQASAGQDSRSDRRHTTPQAPTPAFDPNASTDQLMDSAREMFIADNYELAEMLYKSVLVREPNHLSAMLELAIIYEVTGELPYARGLLRRALVIRPHDQGIIERNTEIVQKLSAALETEIDSLLGAGYYEPAIPKLAILLTTKPEVADLYYKKAECHLKLGNPEVAIVEIDRALNLTRDERYYKLKAKANAALRVREIDALSVEARRALRDDTSGSKDDALRILSRILEIDPDNGWARERFLALTEDVQDRLKDWDVPGRLTSWWLPVKKNLHRAGDGLLLIFEMLRSHLEVLLAILFTLVIFSSPLTHKLVRGFAPRQSLSGRLDHFSIQELLTLVNTHHRTGVLMLKTGAGRGKIFFDDGEIYHCKWGRARGREALQGLLKKADEGFFVFKDRVFSKEDTIDAPLSLILLELPERADSITSESILKKQKQRSKMKSLLGKGS